LINDLGAGPFTPGSLGLCEGDCDNDRDCEPGLKCFQVDDPGTTVPGCSGAVVVTSTSPHDYCWSAPAAPPAAPQLEIIVDGVADLRAALANPSIGRILLKAGTYAIAEQLSIQRSVASRVVLEAAQPGTVVLDGQGKTRVLYITSGSGTVELVGLSITRGYSARGAGVFIEPHAEVTLISCNIYGNTAGYYDADGGGGVYIYDGTVAFTNCNIYSNYANKGGGVYIYDGTVTFTGCDIYANDFHRCFWCYHSYDSYGGGVNIWYATVTFTNCDIYENSAGSGGGVIIYYAVVSFTGSNIYDNEAAHGDANNVEYVT